MFAPVVFAVVIAIVVTTVRIRAARRRRADAEPVVTTWPDIELNQLYGGWDACAYDAGTGRDHSAREAVRWRLTRRAPVLWRGSSPR